MARTDSAVGTRKQVPFRTWKMALRRPIDPEPEEHLIQGQLEEGASTTRLLELQAYQAAITLITSPAAMRNRSYAAG